MITAIDHIELIVRDVKAHVAFFEKLGFELLLWTDHHGGSADPNQGFTPIGNDVGAVVIRGQLAHGCDPLFGYFCVGYFF